MGATFPVANKTDTFWPLGAPAQPSALLSYDMYQQGWDARLTASN
jgi:hypothetical protein